LPSMSVSCTRQDLLLRRFAKPLSVK